MNHTNFYKTLEDKTSRRIVCSSLFNSPEINEISGLGGHNSNVPNLHLGDPCDHFKSCKVHIACRGMETYVHVF
jgi:hypothetical protein